MTVLLTERFEGNWPDSWGGQPRNGYPVNQGSDPDKEARLLIRQGEHYGSDYRHPLGKRVRKGTLEYGLYLSGDWNPNNATGKLPGVLDTRYEPFGYGNNKPAPDGGSIRTWFGPNRQIGLYVYHQGQTNTWGDGLPVATVPLWAWVTVLIDWDLDDGTVAMTVTDQSTDRSLGSGTMNVTVSPNTAFDVAWLCAYYGGSAVAPSNMAADIDDMIVTDRTPVGVDWTPIVSQLRSIANLIEQEIT